MKANYLLPFRFKRIGIILCIMAIIAAIFWLIVFEFGHNSIIFEKLFVDITYNDIGGIKSFYLSQMNSLLDECIAGVLIIGLTFIAFAKERREDEYISELRLKSLVWATYVNYLILVVGLIFIYKIPFMYVLIFNMFTILLVFILRFYWELRKSKRLITDEK